mmetsp:Transcript_4758/g.9771  ORF Transcript_4758/g.9771 Transcript_4758/m.9771 type:complete len:170 (-) Transcript_4758:27-536(-)
MGWEQDPATGFWWDGEDGPYNGQYQKVPYTAEELAASARALAVGAETAGLITISPDGFPRCRSVTVGRHVSEDLTEVTVATRAHTRKCDEIRACPKVTVFWQEKTGSGAWVSAAGTATVEAGEGDKAKVKVAVQRMEVQDYNAGIMGDGSDNWKPVILERRAAKWAKLQ